MEPIIRPAEPTDLSRLLELLNQLSQLGERPESDVQPPTAAHHAVLSRMIADPEIHLLMLEQDGTVIGTLTVYVVTNLSHGGKPFALVENVVVDEAVQGGGHGRRLMDEAERIARAAGCYKVTLTSNRRRAPAHAFYERLGFAHSHHGYTLYF